MHGSSGTIGTFDPVEVPVHGRTVRAHGEVITVDDGRVLAEVVQAWVNQELPEEPGAAERAAVIAATAYRSGASVSEACNDAMHFVGSWVRHPSHWKADRNGLVALAS